ncbi:nitrous oxide-stimulated promoter family protein [Vibrio sp. Of7-15]|uniref:nitrous oxide-stimulated promoter family protein n=1 Tax=Vibrio sp. Of7-15 TaxID=2724879 RepID=UPI001EF2EB88|nr:nitrous oxide-stimulated promoter family protein [Vibrio sp. Of7-15]MCG7495874.1 nitrous oxide-stimulated promoter family protein [Vibrio sp. Of7-15]
MTNLSSSQIQRELGSIQIMIRLYCRVLHRGAKLCPVCTELTEYVENRLQQCRQEEAKPLCVSCSASCYQAAKRLELKHIIRWAEPKMFRYHPVWAFRYQVCKQIRHVMSSVLRKGA